ncbi:MAG TPA: nuclear transport factor 2 family protein [Mucilaginibacter sp.]|nr:nuclear transport factor 2 family protein [Mucilaginibacter sp.]
MPTENEPVAVESDAKQIVTAFINALNDEDFETAKRYMSHDLLFVGVMGTRNGGDAYMNDMEKMKFKYNIKKSFADGDDVCLFYDIDMGGKTIFSCGWYQVEEGKIKSFKVVFDPRPLLEQADKPGK